MDPDPLRLLETAPPLRSSTLSANPANSRFSVREDRRLASSEAVNKIPQKTLTDQLRSLVLVLESDFLRGGSTDGTYAVPTSRMSTLKPAAPGALRRRGPFGVSVQWC